MDQILNMLLGAAQQAIFHPLSGGIEVWLVTSAMIFVALPFALGIVMSIFTGGNIPKQLELGSLLSFWFRWCVFGPLTLLWKIIQLVGKAIWRAVFPERKSNQKQNKSGRNTYNFNVTLFGGDRNRGQNQQQSQRRGRRGQPNNP